MKSFAAERGAPPMQVLVVDDDHAILRTLADIFQLHGYAASGASTAVEGLRLAKQGPPALAVVDLRLPDMDGMELVHRLHELSELTQVVVLTGNATMESAIAALREHSVDYLLKPVNVDHLMQVVSVAGERFQRRQAELALRESEERYRTLFEHNPQPMWVFDRETLRFLAVNDSAIRLYGYSREDFLGMTIEQIRPPQDISAMRAAAHAPATGVPRNWRHRRRTGELMDVEVTTHDITFGGRPSRIVLAVDVTERLAAENAMRQHQRLEAVGRLAGGVAHDFNNMLTAITGYGEMLRANLPAGDDELQTDVTEILKAAERAAALTRQLLAFSRQQVLQPRLVSLNDSVRDMENMLRRLIGEDVQMVLRLDPALALTRADPSQLQQVIMNLCVNARDAMPGGGTLTLETASVELHPNVTAEYSISAPGEYVMLSVSDTGTGMDDDTKARVFEPFFTTKGDKGTGLGLPTVYGIVKQSGGDIVVESDVGRGTTFKVYFPAVSGEGLKAD
jgi:hypothetical protein